MALPTSVPRWLLRRAGLVFGLCYILFAAMMLVYLQQDRTSLSSSWQEYGRGVEYRPKKPHWDNPTGCAYNEEEVARPDFISVGEEVYVLSAFFDDRGHNQTYIRILGIVPLSLDMPLYCHVRVPAGNTLTIPADILHLHHSNASTYISVIINCNVHYVLHRNPCKVHLSFKHEHYFGDESVILHVLPLVPRKQQKTLAFCPPPVWGFITINRFVEYIELSKLLGADQIFFYIYKEAGSVGFQHDTVAKVMEYYDTSDAAVTHHDWDLPVFHKELWQYGRMLTMHHCLYTNMYKYKYLIFTDMDEFIVPHINTNLPSIMEVLDDPYTGLFRFVTAFFPPEVGENLISLKSLQQTEMTDEKRTKCVVKPETVLQLGLFDVKRWAVTDKESVLVSSDTALVHHYRFCDVLSGLVCQDHVEDRTMDRFSKDLTARFRQVMTAILGYDAGLEEHGLMGDII